MPQITPRLHLRTFKLRMMDDIITANIVSDSHELALLTSPCLYSVWLVLDAPDLSAYWWTEYLRKILDVFCQMMEGRLLASNLGEIGGTRNYSQFPGTRTDDILLAIVRNAAMKKTLRPETLNMDCAYIDNIMTIDPALDLSMLRTLHLLQVHSVSFKDGLSAGSFPLLRGLSLQFVYRDSWRGYDKFKKFIRGFRNLESLRELGWDWSVASFSDWSGEIAPYHKIRSLYFQGPVMMMARWKARYSPSWRSDVLGICTLGWRRCLCLSAAQTKGDRHEALLYQIIGKSFPKLKHLALTLEALAEIFIGRHRGS
ncbi:uncharacterized protein PODANS_5_100 [Podospora anserina S mat+]|uniref:Podospora anserina S mat+ genomic DNA chromosome 5, supercontig 1 n=1 Tax=Podospora anserina (strain S / ATCC MYA-4624 / DSM 980 / FGSC 10383) TaxID=515849 RepID=B2AFA0_PODAN|nr:uncharacterized protein PODANS_5_100 [Podospora anserina S mat+]CAP62117.1 unnamed protein product [Podospora anserina S mat+]CDP29193.1 Putative protein of unknown function [Podospora anserina S mat+]